MGMQGTEERSGSSSAGRQPTSATREERQSVEAHADVAQCKSCSQAKNRTIVIPKECTYSSHTITQLQREPLVPIERADDRLT
jgi:hypothetical protein